AYSRAPRRRADGEPARRITAGRALSQIAPDKDPRVVPVIAAHLTDSSRLVRVSTAEALTALGISRLDGAGGGGAGARAGRMGGKPADVQRRRCRPYGTRLARSVARPSGTSGQGTAGRYRA